MRTITNTAKVKCAICGHEAHVLEAHILDAHDMTIKEYEAAHPGSPILSEAAKVFLKAREAELRQEVVEVEIKKAFGIQVFEGLNTMPGFKHATKYVPDVDNNYAFRKSELKVVMRGLLRNAPALLSGPTGSGKTSIYEQTCARLNWPFTRFNCDADNVRSDLVGQWTLKGEETVWQDGPLTRALREGHVFVLDEWDMMNAATSMLLQPVLEGKPLLVAETGEVVKPSKFFRVVATANTVGLGDDSGLYSGTQVQNYAQLDRFKTVITVDYPAIGDERRVLKRHFPEMETDIINRFLNVAKDVRTAFKAQDMMTTQSTRTLINLVELLMDFGTAQEAYEYGWLNKMNADDRRVAEELIQRHWGDAA